MTHPLSIGFHKMHGAGNDFVLLDLRHQDLQLTPAMATTLTDRRLGVGCDQILIVFPPADENHIARYEIINADGSQAAQCGNGARCIALYLQMNGDITERKFALESPSGVILVERCNDDEFEIDMGVPDFEPCAVPINLSARDGQYQLESKQGTLNFFAVSVGNPHALLLVPEIDSAPVETIGNFLGQNNIFPRGCNIGFAEIQDRNNIRLRVYERGAGETLACGSGACAAVAMLRKEDRLDETVNVFLPGGHLVIKWPGTGNHIRMKGPATHVFKGTVSHE
jgi:diaminopimelate epimerase